MKNIIKTIKEELESIRSSSLITDNFINKCISINKIPFFKLDESNTYYSVSVEQDKRYAIINFSIDGPTNQDDILMLKCRTNLRLERSDKPYQPTIAKTKILLENTQDAKVKIKNIIDSLRESIMLANQDVEKVNADNKAAIIAEVDKYREILKKEEELFQELGFKRL